MNIEQVRLAFEKWHKVPSEFVYQPDRYVLAPGAKEESREDRDYLNALYQGFKGGLEWGK